MGFRRLQFTRQPSPRAAVAASSEQTAAADPSVAGDCWPCLCHHCRRLRGDAASHERARQRYIEQMPQGVNGGKA